MKRMLGLGVLVVVLVTSVALGAAPSATAAQGALAGTWTSIDSDGSNQTLTITGSGKRAYAMAYFDDAASLCGGAPAMANGSARVDGDDLFMRSAVTCLPGGNRLRGVIWIQYTYDADSDTLTDSFGIVWSRA